MTIQLIGKDDSSFDDAEVLTGRWQAYIDSYVSVRVSSVSLSVKLTYNAEREYRRCFTSPSEPPIPPQVSSMLSYVFLQRC